MEFHQHRFDSVQGYLHHRPPYLLVERIVSIAPDEVVTEMTIKGDEFYIQGHFPGAPVLPGAMMHELTTQTAGILIAAEYNPMEVYNTSDPFFNQFALGVLVKTHHARYRGFGRPGERLCCTVRLVERVSRIFDFAGTVSIGEKTIMRNAFQLTNIESSTLMGDVSKASSSS